MIYIVIYNPISAENNRQFRNRIMSIFPTGISIENNVYLVAEDKSSTPQDKFEEIIKQCTSSGDSLIVAPLTSGIGIKGYPSDFREWIQKHRPTSR